MNTMKTLLAVSVAAVGALGAANAAQVGSFNAVSITGTLAGTLPPAFGSLKVNGIIVGSGTALLDDGGTLTVTDSQVSTDTVGTNGPTSATTPNTSTFTGTYASGVFTGTAGTFITGSGCGLCLIGPNTGPYLSVTGTVAVPAGGSLVTTLGEFGGNVIATETWTFSGFTPVPLPPAAWLLGSGLLGLAGSARRRRAVRAS